MLHFFCMLYIYAVYDQWSCCDMMPKKMRCSFVMIHWQTVTRSNIAEFDFETSQHVLIFPLEYLRPRGPLPTKPHASHHQRALPSSGHSVTPRRPHHGIVCCCVQRTAYSACIVLTCIVNGDDSAVFWFFCPRWPWHLTSTFELGQDFCTVYLNAKFHHPTFNRSEVIVQTNKLTDKQTPRKTPTSLCYAVG